MTAHDRMSAAAHVFLAAHYKGEPPTECMRNALAAYNSGEKRRDLPEGGMAILAAVARKYNVTVEALRGRDRWTLYALPRQEAVWQMRQVRLSFPVIADVMGRDDHAAAIEAYRQFEERMKADPVLAGEMAEFRTLPPPRQSSRRVSRAMVAQGQRPRLVSVGGGRAA